MSGILLTPATQMLILAVERIVSPVYLVGGSVRDCLLGFSPHDYDFCTPLPPDEVEAAIKLAGKRAYIGGKRFGTIGMKLDGQIIEITTFRLERYRVSSRKPAVEFVDDITYDLSRRDFTMNAMALRSDGHLIDPFGGRHDVQLRLIRTVNKACDRYNEDPLRMLRAARFAAELGFDIEDDTLHQAVKKADKILEVSKERWTQELDKLLLAPDVERGLHTLAHTHLLHYMLPELAIQIDYDQDSPYHELTLWEHTVKTVHLTKPEVLLRWAALLHDIGKPYVRTKNTRGYSNYAHHEQVGGEMAQKIGTYLKWSKARTATVASLVSHHLATDSPLIEADAAATKR